MNIGDKVPALDALKYMKENELSEFEYGKYKARIYRGRMMELSRSDAPPYNYGGDWLFLDLISVRELLTEEWTCVSTGRK